VQTFGTGIAATVAWYLDNEWWWRPLRDGVYSGSRLGLLQSELGEEKPLAESAI
jgi:dTDP-glucose 4,6-dehydratase